MFALEIKNLTKQFYNYRLFSKEETVKNVLNNCNLNINTGEIFGIAGLNGIGKSTMIKIILDLLQPDGGEVNIFGLSHHNAMSRKNICYLPEKFQPSQYLTGYEFLNLSLSFFDRKITIDEINKMAERLDLDVRALSLIIKKYSKGMGQKLGLLYCLLSNAKLLILDEPMTGLDPKARVILKRALIDYVKQGNTIFFSSHILDDVEEICDKIAVLHNGEIKFNGKTEEFKNVYKTQNVEKAFLECINDNML